MDLIIYRNFLESLRSRQTKKLYDYELKKFIEYIKGEDHLISDYPKLIEAQIIDYICDLKNKGLSQSTLSLAFSAISHFYTMNDILLNKKKITKFMNADTAAQEDNNINNQQKRYNKKDRGYTAGHIQKLLDVSDDRVKLLVLLFASTGMRLAGLTDLKIRNLSKIQINGIIIYQITVYEGSKEEYVTFCTPECAKAIDSYFAYRERSGEKLDPNSPLVREQFDSTDLIRVKNPKFIISSTVEKMIDRTMRQAGLRQLEHPTETRSCSQMRKQIPLIHGFRKFFNTALMNSDVHPSFKKLLMGHSVELDEVYYDKNSDKSQAKLLKEYSKAINALTINEENRLKRENQLIRQRNDILERDKDEITFLRKELEPLLALKTTLIKEGLLRETANS